MTSAPPPARDLPSSDDLLRRGASLSWFDGLRTMARVTRYNFLTPWQATGALIATLIAASFQLMIPVLLGRAVDATQVLVQGGAGAEAARAGLTAIAWMVLGAAVVRGIFTTAQNYWSESVGHHTGYRLRLEYYQKIQTLSFGFHDRVHSGDLITLGLLDLDGVRMYFSTALVRLFLLSMLIGLGGYRLLSTDFTLGLVALSFVPFVGWRSSVTHLRLRATWLDLQERLSVLSRVMEENLAGIRVVRAFAAQPHELAKYAAASAHALELQHRRVAIRVRDTSAMNLSFFLAMGLMLWIGGGKVIAGEITVGTLAAFLTFMTILQMPVRQLGLLVNAIARTSTCGARLFHVLDLAPEIADKPGAGPLEVTEGVVRFDNVDFAYDAAAKRPALSGVSFTARRGETIGLIGPPGSGKTTIAHLIPRFYDVTGGSVSIDGQDVRDVTLGSLRKAVAVVQQDVFLFTTSLENNIAYGDPWAKPSRVERASEWAQLLRYILELPQGFRTVVGERGASLSGGQRQRMTIARTLMLQPAVLVFDDSTAAVDANTERLIREAIRETSASRVTIIVAHRLSSLMHADRILYLENGRIVEQGSHAELLRLGGRYRQLYDLQVRPKAAS